MNRERLGGIFLVVFTSTPESNVFYEFAVERIQFGENLIQAEIDFKIAKNHDNSRVSARFETIDEKENAKARKKERKK